jgi:hypothetical protein
MLDAGFATYRDSLDLLWRFVPTPFRSEIHVGHLRVQIESNDLEIPQILCETNRREFTETECTFLWKIIRDPEIAGGLEAATILTDGDMSFLKMGLAVQAAMDREQRELLAFVGTGVCVRAFKESVAPLLVRLTLGLLEGVVDTEVGPADFAFTQGNGNE